MIWMLNESVAVVIFFPMLIYNRMSYTEYLRRKAAATQVVVNTVKPTDASMYTSKLRQENSNIFATGGNQKGSVIGSGGDGFRTYVKASGKSADASAFTSFRGGQGLGNDAPARRGEIRLPCTPMPRALPTPKTGSQWTSEHMTTIKSCNPEPENPSVFVDNTISISGLNTCADGTRNVGRVINTTANHAVKAEAPHLLHPPRNVKTSVLPYQPVHTGYKAGKALDKIPYVEKHHGNDLRTTARFQNVPFQGSPLPTKKIDEPRQGNVKP